MNALRRIFAITRKEIEVLFARPLERRVIIIPPIVMLFVFSWAATRDVRNVDAAILDRDHGAWSLEIRQRLEGSPTFRSVSSVNGMQEARTALDMQRVLFVLVFDDDFSRKIEAGEPAVFQILLDGRRSNAAQIAQTYVAAMVGEVAMGAPLIKTLFKGEKPPRIDLQVVNWFNPNLEFTWFYLPSLMGLLSMMMGFLITGLSVARERELGTFDQMLVSPAQPLEIAIAKLIPGGLVALTHGTIFLLGSHLVFHVPLEGSLALLYVAMFIFAISVSGIGLMISSFVATQQQAFLGCFTIAVPFILLSGYASPVDNMSPFLQYLGEVDPLRHFLVIIQGVFLKDVSLASAMVNLGKMSIIALVTSVVAIRMFKKRV